MKTGTFTKTYRIEPNQDQRKAMKRFFEMRTIHALSIGQEVNVQTWLEEDKFNAELSFNNVSVHKITLGLKGGISRNIQTY